VNAGKLAERDRLLVGAAVVGAAVAGAAAAVAGAAAAVAGAAAENNSRQDIADGSNHSFLRRTCNSDQ